MKGLPPDARIFGIGLSRTGTHSLGRALQVLGYRTIHFPHDPETHRALRDGTFELPILEDHHALVDIVAAPYYPQLDDLYPGSKFILTVRDRREWLRSVEAHFDRLETLWPETSESFRSFTRFICTAVYGCQAFHRDRFDHVYRRHVRAVRDYFADRPDDLLVLDICSGEGWGRLCPFLEEPVPHVEFPHEDQSPDDTSDTTAARLDPESDGPATPDYPAAYHREMAEAARPSARRVVSELIDLLDPQSVIDVGCGLGSWLATFRARGVSEVLGLDQHDGGSRELEIPSERYRTRDLTRPLQVDSEFDLALCLEVAEHLPEAVADRLVEDLVSLAPVTLFGAAVPGQRGLGHVNEQWPEYWARRFSSHGYLVVDALRPRIWKDPRIDWWYRQNLLLFVDLSTIEARPRLREVRGETREEMLSVVHPDLFERTEEERSECAAELWRRRTESVGATIRTYVPQGSSYLMIDDGGLRADLTPGRRRIPFPEREGDYAGPPASGADAVRDLRREREGGIQKVVVAWPAFWWLDHYEELSDFLDARARCVHADGDARVFDLSRRTTSG